MESETTFKSDRARPVIKLVVFMGVILIVKYIVLLLPLLDEIIIENTPMTLKDPIEMLFSTLMLIVWVNFGREIDREITMAVPSFPESGYMIRAFVVLIAVVAGYQVYFPLAKTFISKNLWIYQLGFIVLAIFPIAAMGRTLYQNVDKLINVLMEKGGIRPGKHICKECGKPADEDAKFCPECGGKIIRKSEEKPVETETHNFCPECGNIVSRSAKFCKNCGIRLKKGEEK
ncbi:MAG: zinc ribbon domain-containing protein [Candidatus Eremiobacteraeota bacterium]|nr:zinc ribbon domain-containing protein [Candidatus Eremiobacteraeota bacterium]